MGSATPEAKYRDSSASLGMTLLGASSYLIWGQQVLVGRQAPSKEQVAFVASLLFGRCIFWGAQFAVGPPDLPSLLV